MTETLQRILTFLEYNRNTPVPRGELARAAGIDSKQLDSWLTRLDENYWVEESDTGLVTFRGELSGRVRNREWQIRL